MNTILTLQDVGRARAFYEKGYWRSDTLYTLLRGCAEQTPDRFALRDTSARLTFRDALEWVDAIARDLHDSGLRAGDRVSIWSPSRVESALIFLTCSRMGYVCNTSLHRDYTCREIVDLLQRAGSVAFFVQPGYGADAEKNDILSMLGDVARLKKVYRLAPLQPHASDQDLPDRIRGLARAPESPLAFSTDPDRTIYLAYTSGTTRQPSGVMHSDNTILANSRAMVSAWGFAEH